MLRSITSLVLLLTTLIFSSNTQPKTSNFNSLQWLNLQDSTMSYKSAASPLFKDGTLYLIYAETHEAVDSLFIANSSDGINWNERKIISVINRENDVKSQLVLSSVVTSSGRIILTYTFVSDLSGQKKTFITFSDDNGLTWSEADNFKGVVFFNNPKIIQMNTGRLWTNAYSHYMFYSDDDGVTWEVKRLSESFLPDDFTIVGDSTILLIRNKDEGIEIIKSTDLGNSWSDAEIIYSTPKQISNIEINTNVDSAWIMFNVEEETVFPNIARTTINYIKTDLDFTNLDSPKEFTNYVGSDGDFNTILKDGKLFLSFLSDRKYGALQNWFCQFNNKTIEANAYPVIYKTTLSQIGANIPIILKVYAYDKTTLDCKLIINDGSTLEEIILNDSGTGNDNTSNDNIFSGVFEITKEENNYNLTVVLSNSNGFVQTSFLETIRYSKPIGIAKTEKWLNIGSYHNWYSSIGGEREADHPAGKEPLWGCQWPAYYPNQDMQSAEGLWIGCKNYTEPEENLTFEYKTVHCGPRPQAGGDSEFFPIEFKHYAKFQPTEVKVDGELSSYPGQAVEIDNLSPNMPYDQMIYNVTNTQLGMTIKRKIYQFSNPYYDNFHVIEYTFINSGNIDADAEVERKSGILEDVYFYFQNRMSFVKETRLLFGDPTSWGANTLNNEVGLYPAGNNEELRYSYAWHGYYDKFSEYNSVGGPIWYPDDGFGSRINAADTVGRLGAAQFAGTLTLFAQNGTDPLTDDSSQPSTTGYESSDGALQYASDTYNGQQMQDRYALMVKGHPEQSHADWITGGDYVGSLVVGGDKSINGAGYSYVNGYGPYKIAFEDSVKIIRVEGVSGLSRDESIRIGKLFKNGSISVAEKNTIVLSGQDSLRMTFERASNAFKNNWNIPQAPYPPKTFNVNSGGEKVELNWTTFNEGPEIKGFEIYRNTVQEVDGYVSNEWFSKYELIAELDADARGFSDSTQQQDISYYYYILTVGKEVIANEELKIKAHKLKSNRSYTQTYVPAYRRIVSVHKENQIVTKYLLSQNYPNPFNPSTTINYSIAKDGNVHLCVYDILGREVATLVNETKKKGKYKIEFDASILSSGIYFYKLQSGRFVDIKKLILLR